MGGVVREGSTGDKTYAFIMDVVQQAVNTVTADYSGVPGTKGFAYALGSNLAAAARTITERHDVRLKQIVFAGLEAAGVAVAGVTTTTGSTRITSAAAFSTTQHQGAGIVHANLPADTYITNVIDTSTADVSRPATASGSAGATLFDRIVLMLFQ